MNKIPFYTTFTKSTLDKRGVNPKKLSELFLRPRPFADRFITKRKRPESAVHSSSTNVSGTVRARLNERKMEYKAYAPLTIELFQSSHLKNLIKYCLQEMPKKDRNKTYLITVEFFNQTAESKTGLAAHQDQYTVRDQNFGPIEIHPEYLAFLILENRIHSKTCQFEKLVTKILALVRLSRQNRSFQDEPKKAFTGGDMFLQANTRSASNSTNEEGTHFYGVKDDSERLITMERISGNGYFVQQPNAKQDEPIVTHGFDPYFTNEISERADTTPFIFGNVIKLKQVLLRAIFQAGRLDERKNMTFCKLSFEVEPKEGTPKNSLKYPFNRDPTYKTQLTQRMYLEKMRLIYILLALLAYYLFEDYIKNKISKLIKSTEQGTPKASPKYPFNRNLVE